MPSVSEILAKQKGPFQPPKPKKLEPKKVEPSTGVKIAVFGPSGSGKTYTINALLEMGYRVLVISTDLGGSGLATVTNYFKNRPEVLDRIEEILPEDYPSLVAWLSDPGDLSQYDWLVWDGFSTFQTLHLRQWVGEEFGDAPPERAGFKLELQDWGIIQKASLDLIHTFLSLPVRNKIITFQEGYKFVRGKAGEGSAVLDTATPLLEGSAKLLVTAAFDLVIRTRVKRVPSAPGQEDEAPRKYYYDLSGHENLVAKQRGYGLPPTMEADFKKVLEKVLGGKTQ